MVFWETVLNSASTAITSVSNATTRLCTGILLDASGSAGLGFINTLSKFSQLGVSAFGAAIAAAGIMNFGEGKSQQSQGKQDEGMTKIVGGAVIVVVGIFLVPEIFNMITENI